MARRSTPLSIAIDTGGTFTDFVFQTDDGLRVFKIASTPADPSVAINATGFELRPQRAGRAATAA